MFFYFLAKLYVLKHKMYLIKIRYTSVLGVPHQLTQMYWFIYISQGAFAFVGVTERDNVVFEVMCGVCVGESANGSCFNC